MRTPNGDPNPNGGILKGNGNGSQYLNGEILKAHHYGKLPVAMATNRAPP